jgi:5-methylcytosine-specific restriction endonuclease McrA
VIKRESKFNKTKLTKPYYYTAYLWCPYCQTMYMRDDYKVINWELKEKKNKERARKRYEHLDGQITKEKYQLYRNSPIWKNRRNAFIERHPFCFVCGIQATEVHHNSYDRLGREKARDLVAMCHECHFAAHDLIKAGKAIRLNAHIIYKSLYMVKDLPNQDDNFECN